MRSVFRTVAVAALLAACKTGPADSELVAKINGEGITKTQFDQEVERNLARYRGQGHTLPPGIETRIKESVLRRMIDDLVIKQKGKEIGVVLSPEELEAKFKEHKDRFRTDKAFQDYLTRSNNTEANMKDDLERNLLRDRVVEKLSGDIALTDEEVQKYYDENLQRFKEKEQVKVSRILLRLEPNATDADKKAALKKAKEALGKARAKGADFAAVAKTFSNGPEAARGGELGWMTRGRMPPEFDNVAFALKPEQVSDLVESKLGYEIIKLWEAKPERQRPLDEVKENIKNSLIARKRNEKRRDVLRDLKKDAKVEQLVQFEQPPPGAPAAPEMPGAPGMPPMPGMAGAPQGLPTAQMPMPMPGRPEGEGMPPPPAGAAPEEAPAAAPQ